MISRRRTGRFCVKTVLPLLVALVWATGGATYREGYYTRMDGKKREALKEAAKQCVSSHQRLAYYDLPVYWQYSDVYPELVDGATRWWEMYSDRTYLIQPGQSPTRSFSQNRMQREHAVPKSWWKSGGDVEYTPAYSDMWNLYPSDGEANQAKLNYPLGETTSPRFDNGVTKVGGAAPGFGGGCSNVFEPADEYKGDFARAFFYMATVYDDLDWSINYMFRKDSWPTLLPWASEMLLRWSRQDPVSQKEIDRNDAVEVSQGNRNPFVDFPELAEYIWGTRMQETFVISEQGGSVTPPITGDPELTRPVNGETLDFGQTAVGIAVNAPLEIEGKNLTSPLSVRVVGTDRDLFQPSLTAIPASNVNTGKTYLLNIVYKPATTGRHTARVLLYDGGLDDGRSISVTLTGESLPVPQLTRLTALDPSDVSATGYTARWTAAPETVDYYVVNRVRYLEDGPEGETLQASGTSLEITGREEGVTESYTVCSSRLGCLSEESNPIVIGGSGVESVGDGYPPLAVGLHPGGFSLMMQGRNTGLRVFDVTGRLIMHEAEAEGGTAFALPAGIYIVTTDQAGRPVKIVIN